MENRLQRIFTYSLISSMCSILVGIVFYQEHVFVRTHYAFQFITVGLIGSVFFSILRFGNVRDAFAGLFALFIIQFLITRSSSAMFILRDIGFIVAVGTSIYLFFVSYFKKGKGGGILAPVIIGALLGACNLIVTFILLLVGRHSLIDNFPALVLNAVIGILIGLGIGTGILISDKVMSPKSA